MLVLGVMTGTSLDGLDAVCVEFTGGSPAREYPDWHVHWHRSMPYPAALRAKILALQLPGRKIALRDFLALDGDLGEWYGKSVAKLIDESVGESAGSGAARPELIANHGQTVAHHPPTGTKAGFTLQLGDPSRIAAETGLTVISHFREGDMAARGQGAPLLPLFHRMLAHRLAPGAPITLHNLGGISNLTYVSPRSSQLIAFDTGPGNIWIDEATALATRGKKKFDARGELARKGAPDMKAVKRVLSMPYFKKAPPKSTGRDDFPFASLRAKTRARGADLVATATEATVESIARAYEAFILRKGLPLEAIYFAGGGAKNDFLLERLATRLAPVQTRRLADAPGLNLDGQALEPLGFAMFGYLSLLGQAIGGSWTGARSFGPPGWITPGRNWASVASRAAELLK